MYILYIDSRKQKVITDILYIHITDILYIHKENQKR